jgi:hypothetical protein
MNEYRDKEPLSTADFASGPERRTQEMEEPVSDGRDYGVGAGASDHRPAPLLPDSELGTLRSQWLEIQSGFVDEPRRAVEEADRLVAEVMKRIAEVFADERSELERQWDRGDDVSTEDLRVGLQRYRSFFDRLLSI